MAALSEATVVVEAGARSVSMKVAQYAHRLGRTVGAVPGPVMSVTSVGPHQLLSQGACVVANAGDIEGALDRGQRTMRQALNQPRLAPPTADRTL